MTIKPLINQKSSKEENHQESQSQNLVSNARTNHRNVLNQLSTSENQPLQREKRVLTPHTFDNDTVLRHRRSPHKNVARTKRDHLKRETRDRDKNASPNYQVLSTCKKQAPCSSPLGAGGRSPKSTIPANSNLSSSSSSNGNAISVSNVAEEPLSGYNSGDEHIGQKDAKLTPDEWKQRDEAFIKVMSDRGFIIKDMVEDGACLFRAISLQIYGDQDMHEAIRQQTMDYITQNSEYFAQFVTEDIDNYVTRKRANHVHGNHIEIQAMSEMYNRSVELYCYQLEPINIFNSEQINNGNEPLRLSYQRCSHYNAILDPYKASVGVGLGLAGYRPDEVDVKQMTDAVRLSEELEIEQTMFEDKLKTTDWEATNEAIEEQIARESYLQWCRDNMNNPQQKNNKSTSTITSTDVGSCSTAINSDKSPKHSSNNMEATTHAESMLRELRKSTSPSPSNLSFSQGSSSSSKNSSFEQDCSMPESSKSSSPYSVQYYFNNNNSNNINRRKKRQNNLSLEKRRVEETTPVEQQVLPKKSKLSSRRLSIVDTETASCADKQTPPAGTSSDTQADLQLKDESFSEFYQSLLQSSYTDDGSSGQLSEREMIRKALEVSAMDFVKRVETRTGSLDDKCGTTTDEEYDSPSP